jgi:hypothetical protein
MTLREDYKVERDFARAQYVNPDAVAALIAGKDCDVEQATVDLLMWVASEMPEYVSVDNRDDWNLIYLVAELVALCMFAQHEIETRTTD